jgi:hypothetical protein
MKEIEIDVNRVRELLDYDPDTGRFTWKLSRMWKIHIGDEAGFVNKQGYRRIKFDKKVYLAHRLAWAHFYMQDPGQMEIDHIDKNISNNTIINLRLASHSQNMRNKNIYSNNTSGVIGVCFRKDRKKWRSEILINGKTIRLGLFKNKQDAIRSRIEAEDRYLTDGFIPDNPGREIIY